MQFAKNLVLAVKVLINGSFSNAGFLGNLFNCSLMKAFFAKNPSRRLSGFIGTGLLCVALAENQPFRSNSQGIQKIVHDRHQNQRD